MGNGLRKERSKKRDGKEEERFSRPSQMKVEMEGPGGVGKSSLSIRYVQVLFSFSSVFSFIYFLFLFLKDFFSFSFSQGNFVEYYDPTIDDSFEFSSLLFDFLLFLFFHPQVHQSQLPKTDHFVG